MIEVSVRNLTRLFGQNSGLLLDISNITKARKWKSAWLVLCKEKYSWYVIYKVYWENAVKTFAKEENPAFWLQNEFYYLKNEDKNILMTKDAWLNDRIMDAVQKLIRKALGKIDSFQLVLHTHKKDQITHSEQLTTSTYSCHMTETTIGFFLFVPVAVFRYAIA